MGGYLSALADFDGNVRTSTWRIPQQATACAKVKSLKPWTHKVGRDVIDGDLDHNHCTPMDDSILLRSTTYTVQRHSRQPKREDDIHIGQNSASHGSLKNLGFSSKCAEVDFALHGCCRLARLSD